jgi:hypothetical protein
MAGSVQSPECRNGLGTGFYPPHPAATFALFEDRFARAFDDARSNRVPGTPIARIVKAIAMKREVRSFGGHDFLSRRR